MCAFALLLLLLLLLLLQARHMQMHVAYSMRSFPSIYSGINSVWAHNSCEGVLMWVSPYQLNELLSVVDTCLVRSRSAPLALPVYEIT